jgi:hypothetical protein
MLSQDALERRASGRRHYNAVRQSNASFRRSQVAQRMAAGTTSRVALAARLGVHPSTISRDITALLGARPGACPTCGRPFVPAWAAEYTVPLKAEEGR